MLSKVRFRLPIFFLALASLCKLFAEDPKAAIQQKVESEYTVTQATDAEDEIISAGSVLVLKKRPLMMSATTGTNMYQNIYKDGKLTQNAIGKADAVWGRMKKLPGMSGGDTGTSPHRTYVTGEKMWLTKVDVRDDGLVLSLLTDPVNDVRYKAALKFPWVKGSIPPADQVEKEVAEVFSVQAADNGGNGGQQQTAQGAQPPSAAAPAAAPAAAKPDAPPAPIAPPAAPTDAPTQTIALGQTTDQVTGILGQPQKIVKLGTKQIYVYKDMKITFKDGKVSDVQ